MYKKSHVFYFRTQFTVCQKVTTEHHERDPGTPARIREATAIFIEVFVNVISPSRQMPGYCLELGPDLFSLHPSIIH
jgi:hypothetical protein